MSLYAKYVPPALGGGGGGGGGVTSVGLADGSTVPLFSISGSPVTTSGTLTFTLKTEGANLVFAGPISGVAAQPGFRALVSADISSLFGNLTEATSAVLTISGGTGAVLGSGVSIQVKQASASVSGYLSSTDWSTFNGKQAAGNYATSGSGDVSWSAPSGAGPVTTALVATTNATLLTLSALTTASSLATIGTVTTGVWHGTIISSTFGGTGISTAASTGYPSIAAGTWSVATAAATFVTLFETVATTAGDLIRGGTAGTPTRLAIGSTGNVLTVSGGVPAWAPPATSGTVTSVAIAFGAGGTTVSGSPVTGSGTITLTPKAATYQTLSFYSGGTITGNRTSGSPTLAAVSSFTGLYVGLAISGTGIPASTYIAALNSGASTITMSANASSGAATSTVVTPSSTAGTYVTPANVLFVTFEIVGGGGGAGGSGTVATPGGVGGAGGATTLSTAGSSLLISVPGGSGGFNQQSASVGGGGGGAATINSPVITIETILGTTADATSAIANTANAVGTHGAPSYYGGGGATTYAASANAGIAPGSGGGGAGTGGSAALAGFGGGSSTFVKGQLNSPSATYLFTIGQGGTVGSAGLLGVPGATGANGQIIATENY